MAEYYTPSSEQNVYCDKTFFAEKRRLNNHFVNNNDKGGTNSAD